MSLPTVKEGLFVRAKHSKVMAPARAAYRRLKARNEGQQSAGTLAVSNGYAPMANGAPQARREASAEGANGERPASPWLEKAIAMAPLVRQYRDDAERERHLPLPIFEAMREAGFQRMMVPKAFGGEQVDLTTALEVVEELARQDGSVGWNAWIYVAHGAFADYLPEQTAQEIYGDGGAFLAGNITMYGGCEAKQVQGGYRLTGRWPFASGCHNADWLLSGAPLMEGGKLRLGPDGRPLIRAFVLRASDCEILDSWYTTGLRGTGSHDFQVKDLFVPEAYSVPSDTFWTVRPNRPGLAYGRPFTEIGAPMLGAVALGIARDAIETFQLIAAKKTAAGGGAPGWQENLPIVLEKMGRAETTLQAARLYLYETARSLSAAPIGSPPMNEHAGVVGAFAADSAEKAVDLMFNAGGGTSIYANSRLDRCFRDVHVITHHALVNSKAFIEAGRLLSSVVKPESS